MSAVSILNPNLFRTHLIMSLNIFRLVFSPVGICGHSHVVKLCGMFLATHTTPVSASCHVISCKLSKSATVTVSLCVDRLYICSSSQKATRIHIGLRGSYFSVVLTLRCKEVYFDADCGSNFFQSFKLQGWWRCVPNSVLYKARRLVSEHLLLKRKYREKKWRSTMLSTS